MPSFLGGITGNPQSGGAINYTFRLHVSYEIAFDVSFIAIKNVIGNPASLERPHLCIMTRGPLFEVVVLNVGY